MTDFRLLGTLAAPVPLPGGKPRALLARLLLEPDRVVSQEALVDALWGDPAPPSAKKVLQAHVSALRKALGRDAIQTRGAGYVLRDASSDLAEFERLNEAARGEPDAARRAQLLRDALALWRGPALVEFRREPFAAAAAARLDDLRLDAIARRVDAELELGEHERLVGELTELVAEAPLRERPRRQLMLALYRSGRQAEALAVYRNGRKLLVEELGIEPGYELQELQRSMLRQDPALDRNDQPEASARGPIVCVGDEVVPLLAPLERELVVVELAPDPQALAKAAARLEATRARHDHVRTACFTSTAPGSDLARFANDQGAELVVVTDPDDELLAAAPCDVAVAVHAKQFTAHGPIVVPFGGGRDEWAAVELGAWLARAHGLPLRLLGADARDDRRDASRILAAASLSLQRFAATTPETALVPSGAAGILGAGGAAIVASLPSATLDATRRELIARAPIPVVLVHGGLRPGGLAPDRTLTRFSWSLAHA